MDHFAWLDTSGDVMRMLLMLQGDSGGPLICEASSGQWVQVGIASWNIGCAYVGFPAVYADVEYFTDWINQQTSLHNE